VGPLDHRKDLHLGISTCGERLFILSMEELRVGKEGKDLLLPSGGASLSVWGKMADRKGGQ